MLEVMIFLFLEKSITSKDVLGLERSHCESFTKDAVKQDVTVFTEPFLHRPMYSFFGKQADVT